MTMTPKKIILLAGGFLLLIILLQNTEVVSFRFLFWKFSMSRIILLPLILAGGIVIGFFIGKKHSNPY